LTVESSKGCTDILYKEIEIEKPSAKFAFSPITDSSYKFTAEASNITSWHWSFGDGKTSTDSTPLHTYKKEGQYLVNLVAETKGGCRDSTQQLLTVDFSGIQEIKLAGGEIRVSPNPFREKLMITYELASSGNVKLDVLDLAGRVVYKLVPGERQSAGAKEYSVSSSDLNSTGGFYIIRLAIDNRVYYRKAVMAR
jgi:PKD repeat protein